MDQDKPRGFSRSAVHRRVKQSMKQCIASVVANQHSPTVVVPMICTDDFAEISTDDFIEFPLSSDMNFDPVPCVTDAEFTDMSGTDAADHTLPSSTLFLSGDIYETESINSDCDCESSDQCDLEDMWSVSNANYGVPLNNLLAEWAVSNNVSTSALRSLLNILKPFHPELPRDPRTLLQTPTTYIVRNITGPGHYYHFGISAGIEHVKCPDSGPIQLQFNFDGLPLFKSSKIELWPILCLVFGSKSKPFVVGIYCGKSKPKKLDEFLFDFILDLEKLLTDGILLCGVKRQITVHCFVCDAPARAYIKNIKLHSGYHGCERCVQEGEYVEGKVTFPSTTACLRTDDDFRQMIDDEHHHGPSPLTALGFGMVSGFVLDYMHLVCQGVVRRLITFWIKGRPLHRHQFSSRLPATLVSSISDRLTNLAAFVPREFARKPRGVGELDRWKATEFRQFIIYTGMVVLLDILSTDVYEHFMSLCIALSLLCSPDSCQDPVSNNYAEKLLISFVERAKILYGPGFLVYNVHNLVHLAADAKRFGSLDSISAFPFENHLKQLKRMVRKTSLPLPQIVRRVFEQRNICKSSSLASDDKLNIAVTGEHCNGPLPCGYVRAQQFSKLSTASCVISLDARDGCVAFKSLCKPSLVRNILLMDDEYYLVCEELSSPADLFIEPLPSSCLNIYKVSVPCGEFKVHRFTDLLTKYVYLPLPEKISNSKTPKRSTRVRINTPDATIVPHQSTELNVSTVPKYFAAIPLLHGCVNREHRQEHN